MCSTFDTEEYNICALWQVICLLLASRKNFVALMKLSKQLRWRCHDLITPAACIRIYRHSFILAARKQERCDQQHAAFCSNRSNVIDVKRTMLRA